MGGRGLVWVGLPVLWCALSRQEEGNDTLCDGYRSGDYGLNHKLG